MQKIPEQNNWTPQQQGPRENSHTGHCVHTSESNNEKVQNV
jgi:hypothetical protein